MRLDLDWLQAAEVELAVLRLDQLDPLISGNKWYKLSSTVEDVLRQQAPGIISLGGVHSNHLHALAAAAQRFGFASVGLLRGHAQDTPTIRDLTQMGMQLHWLGYAGYRARHQPDFWLPWQASYPGFACVNEGGLGLAGARGCADFVKALQSQLSAIGWSGYDGWWLAAGTGTTAAGIVLAEHARVPVYVASAVPVTDGVAANIRLLLSQANACDSGYQILDASRGGFARMDALLMQFLQETEAACGLPLEPVYTAKALLELRGTVDKGYFPRGTRLVFVHTGGLQGRRAMLERWQGASHP